MVVQEIAAMTTITITSATTGLAIAQNGVLSVLRYKVASRQGGNFCLVDDAPPYDAVPRQIFNSDMLTQPTDDSGVLLAPYGVCFEDASIAFGNLTVAACPANATFTVDCTGALTTPVTVVHAYPSEAAKFESDRLSQLALDHARRVVADRDKKPPTSIELMQAAGQKVEPPPPPPPPDPLIAEANRRADEAVEAQRAQRIASRETTVGPSRDQIASEWLVVLRHQAQQAAEDEERYAQLQMKMQAMRDAHERRQTEQGQKQGAA
jgi:hypothetical protein